MTRVRISGIGPYAGLVSLDAVASEWPADAESPTDWQGGRLTVGLAGRHQPVSSWALVTWCALMLWPRTRATEDDWRRLAHTNVAGAKADRDAASLAVLLSCIAAADWDSLVAARLHSGKDELLGRLTPGFFPMRQAMLDAGVGLVTFCGPSGGVLLLARDKSHRSALRDGALKVLAAHNQPVTVAELDWAEPDLPLMPPGRR